MAWNKGGLRSSLWVTRGQREHVSSGSRVLKYPMVGSNQDGTQVGLLVIPYLEPTGPIRMEVGDSPSLDDPRSLFQEAHTAMMSKAPYEALDAQDITSANVDLAEESLAPLEKASTA